MMSNGENCSNSVLHSLESRSTFQHFKPLSIYSHMVCRKQYSPSIPLCNIQVKIINTADGRQLEDSCLDETWETPLKKPCLYRSSSPDQGCVVDSLDFLPGVHGPTPVQRHFTPSRSKGIQPVTPVKSTPACMQNRLVHAQECLPSRIPVLNWNRDVPSSDISFHSSLNLDCNSVSVTGVSGKGKVSKVTEICIPSKYSSATQDGVSVNQTSNFDVSDESFETSLPLQVQMKSKIVVPETTKIFCQSAESQSETRKLIQRSRPVVFHSEKEWQRAKRTYLDSVKRHMETSEAGVMLELHHLMNTVAGQHHGQKIGRNTGHWQHPSDLTRRNYRVSGPLLSLHEWQKRSNVTLRRFAKVPDIFRRSPLL